MEHGLLLHLQVFQLAMTWPGESYGAGLTSLQVWALVKEKKKNPFYAEKSIVSFQRSFWHFLFFVWESIKKMHPVVWGGTVQ